MRRAWALSNLGLECGQPAATFGLSVALLGYFSLAIALPQDAYAMSDIQSLIRSIESEIPNERSNAAEQLAHLGEEARPAAVALVQTLATEDEDLREWSVGALEGLGRPDADDVARLSDLLKRSELDVAYWAATLLGRLEEQASPAVAQLIDTLNEHPEMAVRERAAWALGQIGSGSAAAKDDLNRASKSPNPRLAKLAKVALERI